MHLSPLDQIMIEVESPFVCLFALHFIWNQSAHLVSLGHRAMARESRTMSLWVINMIRDVVVHTFAWNALPCQVLPSVAVKPVSTGRFGRPAIYSADRPSIVGRWINLWPVIIFPSRWCSPSAGGVPQNSKKQPWDFGSLQRSRVGKTEAACAWQWGSERNRRVCIGPSSRGYFLLFY